MVELYAPPVKVPGQGPALAMPNEAGGRALHFLTGKRGCAGPVSYSEIRGEGLETVHVFAQTVDFLAYLAMTGREKPTGRAFVMHVPRMASRVSQRLSTVNMGPGPDKHVVLWLGNTPRGEEITEDLLRSATTGNMPAATMNHVYQEFPSLFEWYSATRPGRIEGVQLKRYDDTAWQMVARRPSGWRPN